MKYRGWKFILLGFLATVFAILGERNFSSFDIAENGSRALQVWINQEPFSSDPYNAGFGAHHILYGSIFSKLFSAYKDAQVTPYLAKSWSIKDEGKHWEIYIREDVFFSNGKLISAHDVANSFKRIFYLAKLAHSNLPLMRNIRGIENLRSVDSEIAGIRSNGFRLDLEFDAPELNLAEKLSFGLYAVVSPDDYDSKSGKWKSNIPVSSGPYDLRTIDLKSKTASLFLRKGFPEDLYLTNSFESIEVFWDRPRRAEAQVIEGFGNELPPTARHHFHGDSESNAFFFQCTSWRDKKSPLFFKEIRLALRERFYQELERINIYPIRSLYPLNLRGIVQVLPPTDRKFGLDLKGARIAIVPPKNTQVPAFNSIRTALLRTFESAGASLDLIDGLSTSERTHSLDWRGGVKKKVDLVARSTIIGNEDPRETTELMFSAEGINLPDPRGEIRKLLKKNGFSLSDVNKILFEDAIIWPVLHFSGGFWATEEVDLARYYRQWPLSEFQWLGRK